MTSADKKQLAATLRQMRKMIGLLEWHIKQQLHREERSGAIDELNHEAAVLDAEVIVMMDRLA